MGGFRKGRGRRAGIACFAAVAWCVATAGAASDKSDKGGLEVSGYSWSQYQESMTRMYKGAANFDYDPFVNVGGLLFLKDEPSESWSLNMSLGVALSNSAIKKAIRDTNGSLISKVNPNSPSLDMGAFLYEANAAYKNGNFVLKVGRFHYLYSDYNTNMGLYLLRGPVYPGFLYSGFEQIGALNKTGILGSWSPFESLRWDVIGSFETDVKPYMDLDFSSFLTWHAGMFELGAGVESQRAVQFNSCITSPKNGEEVYECLGGDPSSSYVGPGADLYKGAYFVIDTTNQAATGHADTTTYSMAGTKVMLRGALDFQKLLGDYRGGEKDWSLYFETALIGVKNYPYIYEKRSQRMPVLVGFDVPTYGVFDLLSLEVEYYAAPFQNDPYKLMGAYDVFQFADGNSINYAFSPIPPSNQAGTGHLSKAQSNYDPSKDNWKWSVYAAKKLQQKVSLKAQIASDHWRVPNNNFVQYEAAANPGQFYGSLRIEYSL